MTPADLVTTLAAEIKNACAGLKLFTEYTTASEDNLVEVNVFAQVCPKDLFETTSYLPFVIVELLSVEDELNDESTAQIGLSFAVFGLEEDGFKDLFHLMETVRYRLLTKRVIGKRFRLKEARWEPIPSENQPQPFLYGAATLTYSIFQPQEVLPL